MSTEDDEPYYSHLLVEERFSLEDVIEGNTIPVAECVRESDAEMILGLLNLWKN